MATNIAERTLLNTVIGDRSDLYDQLQGYGHIFIGGITLVLMGLCVVYMLHRFAARPLNRRIGNRRLIRVLFGYLYALVLVTTMLLAIRRLGFEVENLSRVAYLLLSLLAVLAYFLAPFFPRLPFTLGQMIETSGELGFVDSISQFHTTIRKLDGTIVFVPNPLLLASKILNYHLTPNRRIELNVSVSKHSAPKEAMDLITGLMRDDARVLTDPAPSVFVVNASAVGFDLFATCWVANADWFGARSDLWLKLMDAFLKDGQISMTLPRQEVVTIKADDRGTRGEKS